jgi:DNA polymerase-1
VDKSKAERQVVNAIVQGFAANIMKLAIIDLHAKLAGTDIRMLLNVHDELIVQVPVDEVETGKLIVVSSMQGVQYNDEPILGIVPLAAKAGIGMNWAEAK